MKKNFFLILVGLMFSVAAFAQNVSITGKVVDTQDQPLIGASVFIQGTTIGTVADINGDFQLSVPAGATLEVSSIGYVTQHIAVGDKREFAIVLEEDTELLEATVVVGYGTVKRTNFTGSVATYNVGDGPVSNVPKTNAMDMLRGMATGLTISQSGVAGAAPSMQVRGQKSIRGGSDPLIVLDGVIFKGSLQDIDPDAIESMSVMKDATTLASYGSQAANGVIMVNLKKGQKGKPTINFRGSVGLVEQNFVPDLRDGYEYIELMNVRNSFPEGSTAWMGTVEQNNYKEGKWTDWIDYVSQTGVRQNYSLNVSGATDNVNYMVGASYNDNTNFIIGNRYIRETITSRINTKITSWLSFGLNFNFAKTAQDGVRPSYGQVRITPWGSPYMEDGVTLRKYVDGREADPQNPLWSTKVGRDLENRGTNATIGGEIEVKIPWVKGLSYKITGNYTNNFQTVRSFTHETNLIDLGYTIDQADKFLDRASGYIEESKRIGWVIDNILTYTREFDDHYVNATLVYTRDASQNDVTRFSGSDFKDLGNTTLGFYGLTNAKTQLIDNITYNLHTDVGYLARVNYSYKDKYHFNASIRRDGSSVFGTDYKWGNFPAVGAAWTISDEEWMGETKNWLDYLKLKLSWGMNGNQSLSPYGTLSRMAMGKSGGYTYYFNSGKDPVFGQTITTLANPNLGWETTTSWNGGFEADFFNRRLHWELDVYKSKTTDQIFNKVIPVMGSGITSQSATMGRVDNWGIESTLRANVMRKGAFRWDATLNFTMNRNKLVELYGDGKDDVTNSLFLGHSLGAMYGYNWIGIVQEGDTEYIQKNAARPGDAMYEDLTGDGKITPDDRKILGYNKEAFRMSLSNTLSWKNWGLYFMFNGIFSGGGYGLAQNNLAYLSYEAMQYTNMFDHPYWTPENKSEVYPHATYNDGKFSALDPYGFIRLQDLNLSYTLGGPKVKKAGIQSVQFYVSGNNLFFLAPGWKFSDPEVRNPRSQQLARTYTFGVNVRF